MIQLRNGFIEPDSLTAPSWAAWPAHG